MRFSFSALLPVAADRFAYEKTTISYFSVTSILLITCPSLVLLSLKQYQS